jgi:transcriptional regulator with XRE-family HTH domain
MKTLGERIRELREALDISLREFARAIGVSAPFWSDVELGRRHPSDERLQRAAKLLKVPFEELKQHDSRPAVEDFRRVSSADPAFGMAFRRVIDEGVTPQDLVELAEKKRKASAKKKP